MRKFDTELAPREVPNAYVNSILDSQACGRELDRNNAALKTRLPPLMRQAREQSDAACIGAANSTKQLLASAAKRYALQLHPAQSKLKSCFNN